jgi:large subunit ribosomal protein L23
MQYTVFDILKRPLQTEKTGFLARKQGKYVFEVPVDVTRTQVKEAVQAVFSVDVVSVHIINMPAKQSRYGRNRRFYVRKSPFKKAIVTLMAGQKIPIFEGV